MVMTAHEIETTVVVARLEREDVEARIATGLIPARPEGAEHAAWFEAHLRCPSCRYGVRTREGTACLGCVTRRNREFVTAQDYATPEAQERLARAVRTPRRIG